MERGKSYLRTYSRKRRIIQASSDDDDQDSDHSIVTEKNSSSKTNGRKRSLKERTTKTYGNKNKEKEAKEKNKGTVTSKSKSNGTANEKAKTRSSADSDTLSEESTKTLLTYPPNSGRHAVVSLIASDILTLNPDMFLNDQVIDFWLQYMVKETLSERDRCRTHVFSSYFYASLQMASSARRSHHQESMHKNWTKNVNIFQKDFVFVPIHYKSHWVLAVICFPYLNLDGLPWNSHSESSAAAFDSKRRRDKEFEDEIAGGDGEGQSSNVNEPKQENVQKPCILVFDSMPKYMKDKDRTGIYRTIWQFLTAEYQRQSKDQSVLHFTAAIMPACLPLVPLQTNKSDCGLFVFKYFERFFADPILNFDFPLPNMRKWFDRKEIKESRENVYTKILRLTKLHFPENLSQVPTLAYLQKMISDEDEL